ncbi:uncharacterized protein [Chamaea fasciata]|uniref:uncharacterized protein isoform X2 n=1 Tax=Chamaea fasciata TaxID=190680 RepID=UPI003369F5D1
MKRNFSLCDFETHPNKCFQLYFLSVFWRSPSHCEKSSAVRGEPFQDMPEILKVPGAFGTEFGFLSRSPSQCTGAVKAAHTNSEQMDVNFWSHRTLLENPDEGRRKSGAEPACAWLGLAEDVPGQGSHSCCGCCPPAGAEVTARDMERRGKRKGEGKGKRKGKKKKGKKKKKEKKGKRITSLRSVPWKTNFGNSWADGNGGYWEKPGNQQIHCVALTER